MAPAWRSSALPFMAAISVAASALASRVNQNVLRAAAVLIGIALTIGLFLRAP
ncbi:MAG: hypothetical protein NTX21_00830 [Alphaproteobacteria bacterium]|nr:hypothetical protein [Alphaproteobacteria bacterium]